jgi:hypothetical protein
MNSSEGLNVGLQMIGQSKTIILGMDEARALADVLMDVILTNSNVHPCVDAVLEYLTIVLMVNNPPKDVQTLMSGLAD